MEAWVRAKVSSLNLDASVYVEYALGLLQDEDMDISERVSSVIAVFTSAADGLVAPAMLDSILDVSKMTHDVKNLLEAATQQAQKEEAWQLAQKKLQGLQLREQQCHEAEEAVERAKQVAAARLKSLTREELAAREQLVNEYGFTVMSELDENDRVVPIKKKKKETTVDEEGPCNTNKARVQQAQIAMRDKMKKQHEEHVKYEKELLAKDRARKDKTKKRTMKKEKQRGCG